MACNAPTCGYSDWLFTDFTVTPIWRACRYRKFPQRSGMHPIQRNIGDFRLWKDHDAYQKVLERVLRDLQVAQASPP
jgi:hypothetical protein